MEDVPEFSVLQFIVDAPVEGGAMPSPSFDDTPVDLVIKTSAVIDNTHNVIKHILPETVSECSLVSGKEGTDEPCASDAAIQVMAKIADIKKPETMSKADIVQLVKDKLKVDDERSVIASSEFARHAPRSLVEKELKTNFKVAGPTDVSLLNNFNIDQTLQQWQTAFPDFFAYNFNMRDYEARGDTLSTVDVGDLYREGYRTAACVINSDVYAGRGKHWMALFVDCRDPKRWTVEFFNSSGNPPVTEFVNWMVKTKHQLERAAKSAGIDVSVDVVRTSTICHQKSRTECGVYSLYYIYARLNKIPWTEFSNKAVSDVVMFEFRQHLFWDKRRPMMDSFKYGEYQKTTKILWEGQ